jgi:hypothetical protein
MTESMISAAAGIAGTLLGGLMTWLVTRWQLNRQLRRDTYQHVDELYRDLILLYLQYPEFGDAARTSVYKVAFAGKELDRYNFFAMTVHTFLETIFDNLTDQETGSVDPQWQDIFDYHAKLHFAWLSEPNRPNELGYVDFVRRRQGEDRLARSSAVPSVGGLEPEAT